MAALRHLVDASTVRVRSPDGIVWSWIDEANQRAPYGKINPFPARVNLFLPVLTPRATGLVVANAIGLEKLGTSTTDPLCLAVDATVWIADGLNSRIRDAEAKLPQDKEEPKAIEQLQDLRRRIIHASVLYAREIESISKEIEQRERKEELQDMSD